MVADEGILGMHILQTTINGSADILLWEGRIKLRHSNLEIPCIKIGNSQMTRKGRFDDDFTISGSCETIINVFVERNKNKVDSNVL